MTRRPLIRAVVLNWRRADLTNRCVKSLLDAGLELADIIVVDNGSGDESVTSIQRAAPGVRVISSTMNLGYGGGNNLGIVAALADHVDFVWILNNDVVVEQETLPTLLAAMNDDSGIAACTPSIQPPPGTRGPSNHGWGHVVPVFGFARLASRPFRRRSVFPRFLTGTALLLRAAALATPVFDEDFFLYWEDVDLSLRLQEQGWRILPVPAAKVYHEESSTLGRQNPLLVEYWSESRVIFLRKHAILGALPVLGIWPLILVKRFLTGRTQRISSEWRGMRRGFRPLQAP